MSSANERQQHNQVSGSEEQGDEGCDSEDVAGGGSTFDCSSILANAASCGDRFGWHQDAVGGFY